MSHKAEDILQNSLDKEPLNCLPSGSDKERITRIIDRVKSGSGGVFTVLLTLVVKKIENPNQDIRLHQASMPNGFSGRGFDTRYVTPFLRKNNFPYMASGSGWLTRSLEQASPYNSYYPGKIKPPGIKEDFLELVNNIEKNHGFAPLLLDEIISQLIKLRESTQEISLSKPQNKSISASVSLVEKLWNQPSGASRIPVIAVFAAYKCLTKEVSRYKNHTLLPLLAHTAADEKTNRTGDIDIERDSKIIEAVEIKHGIKITPDLVKSTIEKIKRTSVKRYYILSTHNTLVGIEEITELTTSCRPNHGCEIIVNGVVATLKYYLRLLTNSDDFIENFVSLLEKDVDINYQTKILWNKIVDESSGK